MFATDATNEWRGDWRAQSRYCQTVVSAVTLVGLTVWVGKRANLYSARVLRLGIKLGHISITVGMSCTSIRQMFWWGQYKIVPVTTNFPCNATSPLLLTWS